MCSVRSCSSMERYEREVESGQLRWSPVHTAEFWKENFKRFEEDNFRLIRHLATVLATGVDILTLAVACYDIGEFARFHPHGRLYVLHTASRPHVTNFCYSPPSRPGLSTSCTSRNKS